MPIFFLNMHSKISSVTTKRIELKYITFKPILEELFNGKKKQHESTEHRKYQVIMREKDCETA